jgi:hypothetical protein
MGVFMARYVSRKPRADDDYDWYEPPFLTSVEVTESEPVDTGLLDSEGNSIWRVNDPIGFLHYD